jgi:hypothetical protein
MSVGFYQCCGSGMFIPDPNCFYPGSRIRVKEFKYFNTKKWFLSTRKYDPGCAFWILILTFYPSRISDPGVKKAPDPGSRIRIRNTGFNILQVLRIQIRDPGLFNPGIRDIFFRIPNLRSRIQICSSI